MKRNQSTYVTLIWFLAFPKFLLDEKETTVMHIILNFMFIALHSKGNENRTYFQNQEISIKNLIAK